MCLRKRPSPPTTSTGKVHMPRRQEHGKDVPMRVRLGANGDPCPVPLPLTRRLGTLPWPLSRVLPLVPPPGVAGVTSTHRSSGRGWESLAVS